MFKFFINFTYLMIILFSLSFKSFADIVKEIKVNGNERISTQTIILFSKAQINNDIDNEDLNFFLKNLYQTNFFKDNSLRFENNILTIQVIEEPIIQSVVFKGVKAKKILDPIKSSLRLKDRSSFKENIFFDDKNRMETTLRLMGYYFSQISASIQDLGDNKVNLIYDISLGEKAKISKITFTGNKIFKDNKLRSIIEVKSINSEIYKVERNFLMRN